MPGDELAPSVTHLHPRCSCLGTSEDSALLQTRTTLSDVPLPGLEDTPLVLHAGYGIREVLTAAGWLTATRRTHHFGQVCWLWQRARPNCCS